MQLIKNTNYPPARKEQQCRPKRHPPCFLSLGSCLLRGYQVGVESGGMAQQRNSKWPLLFTEAHFHAFGDKMSVCNPDVKALYVE